MKVYMKLIRCDERARKNDLVQNIEAGGWCSGQLVAEDGTVLGEHSSTTIGWLRQDLLGKLPAGHCFEVVDQLTGGEGRELL
jgi:hypothetical protein